MLHCLSQTQTLPLSLDHAWAFFSDPGNLSRITPGWLSFKLTCAPPVSMYAGQILTYTVRPIPMLRLRWVTEITQVRKPFFFVDEQRIGPYRFWHHQHFFEHTKGGLLMTDLVHYALPAGPLGDLVHALWVKKRLASIFEYRRKVLTEMLA